MKIVNVARKYRMPVIPYSGGTSLEGHFTGVRTCFCVTSVARAIICTLDALVEGRRNLRRLVRNGQDHCYSRCVPHRLSIDHLTFLRPRRGRFRSCLPARRGVDENQPNLERESNPVVLSRACETLHILFFNFQRLFRIRSWTLPPLRLLAAC